MNDMTGRTSKTYQGQDGKRHPFQERHRGDMCRDKTYSRIGVYDGSSILRCSCGQVWQEGPYGKQPNIVVSETTVLSYGQPTKEKNMKNKINQENAERTAILAYIRRRRTLLYKNGAAESVLDQWDDVILWILGRNERYDKRKGGLGRKKVKS